MWIVLLETINILSNLREKNLGCSREFYHRFMYITPSSDCILVTFSLPIKVILRRFEVILWCLDVRMVHFSNNWWKFIQIHQYCTMHMALFINTMTMHWVMKESTHSNVGFVQKCKQSMNTFVHSQRSYSLVCIIKLGNFRQNILFYLLLTVKLFCVVFWYVIPHTAWQSHLTFKTKKKS